MNFAEIKARIFDLHRQLDAGSELSSEAAEALKRERAQRFAQARDDGEARVGAVEVVPFEVAGERLAVPATDTVAVVPWQAPQGLPLAPPSVLGVLPFRGEAVIALALHALQGQPPPPPSADTHFVVVRWRRGRVALLADRIHDVRTVYGDALATPEDHGWLDPEAVRGMDGDALLVLDLAGLTAQIDRVLGRAEGSS